MVISKEQRQLKDAGKYLFPVGIFFTIPAFIFLCLSVKMVLLDKMFGPEAIFVAIAFLFFLFGSIACIRRSKAGCWLIAIYSLMLILIPWLIPIDQSDTSSVGKVGRIGMFMSSIPFVAIFTITLWATLKDYKLLKLA